MTGWRRALSRAEPRPLPPPPRAGDRTEGTPQLTAICLQPELEYSPGVSTGPSRRHFVFPLRLDLCACLQSPHSQEDNLTYFHTHGVSSEVEVQAKCHGGRATGSESVRASVQSMCGIGAAPRDSFVLTAPGGRVFSSPHSHAGCGLPRLLGAAPPSACSPAGERPGSVPERQNASRVGRNQRVRMVSFLEESSDSLQTREAQESWAFLRDGDRLSLRCRDVAPAWASAGSRYVWISRARAAGNPTS